MRHYNKETLNTLAQCNAGGWLILKTRYVNYVFHFFLVFVVRWRMSLWHMNDAEHSQSRICIFRDRKISAKVGFLPDIMCFDLFCLLQTASGCRVIWAVVTNLKGSVWNTTDWDFTMCHADSKDMIFNHLNCLFSHILHENYFIFKFKVQNSTVC